MTQLVADKTASTRTTGYAKVWIVHASEDAQWSTALAKHLSQAGHAARAVGISDAMRHIAWERVGGGIDGLRRLLPSMSNDDHTSVMDELSARPPRVVLTRSAESGRAFSRLRSLIGAKFSILGLLNDFEPPSAWESVPPDLLVAPTTTQAAYLNFNADDTTRVGIAGPLPPFERPQPRARETARNAMKVQEEHRAVLIDGSAMRASEIPIMAARLAQIDTQKASLRWLFYYGAYPDNGAAMRIAARTHRVSALMFSDSTPLQQVLPGVDVLISAKHSNTRVESAFLNIPMLAYGADAKAHPLAVLGVMSTIPDLDALSSGLTALLNAQDAPTEQRKPTAKNVSAVHAQLPAAFAQSKVFQVIEHVVGQHIEDHRTDAPTPSSNSNALQFEEVGVQSANDGDVETTSDDGRAGGTYSGPPLSARKAREEMTRLLVELKRLEQKHAHAVEDRDQWMERLQDAEAEDETDLREFADARARDAMRSVAQLQQSIAHIQDARNALREQYAGRAAQDASTKDADKRSNNDVPPEMEARFRALADQRRLRELRRRAGKHDDPS